MLTPSSSYHRPGFVLALALRLLTASLTILIPLYVTSSLGASPAVAGEFIVLLWLGNAVGVALATIAVREQSVSTVVGFLILVVSMLGMAAETSSSPIMVASLAAGLGMGLPQPFLSAIMHLDSKPEHPFSGIGLYSTALGLGLVLGPLMAYGVLEFYGFSGVFVALSVVSVLGIFSALMGARELNGKPRPPIPSPSRWLKGLGNNKFRGPFTVNLLYSFFLPLFLSYGAIYAETRFGFTPASALILFTTVFTISTVSRFLTVKVRLGLGRLLIVSTGLFLASALCISLAPSWQVFVLGIVLFSVPHAIIFPVTSYFAFSAVAKTDVVNASYVFQASSGVAELLSPAIAVAMIPFLGLQGIFLAGVFLAVGTFVASTKVK